MKKYDLKLFQNRGHNSKLKISDKKSENILSIGASVELKNNKICISYKEIEINKCGFDKIDKIEIYKGSRLICCENKNLGFYVEFPNFLSDGIYEIRTTIVNLNNDLQTCIINTFEFFDYNKKINCNNFKLEFARVNKNLCISFKKKIGNMDLSEVRLSNISLFDSKMNQINNVVCKIYSKINNIDFIILDIFDNSNLNKLIPNEVYIIKINLKGNELISSFSFEYSSVEIKAYRVIEDVDYEILSNTSNESMFIRLYFKFNKFINVDDYEYFISNIRSKFLYYKVSHEEDEDIVVFDCVIRKEKNYFDISICRDNNVNVVRFDYDFTFDKGIIYQKKYFDIPHINKNLNKYTVSFSTKELKIDLKSNLFFGIFDKYHDLHMNFNNKSVFEKGRVSLEGKNSHKILFENIGILNKFSEIYTICDSTISESFVFSPSIGVSFNQLSYNVELLNEKKLNINFFGNDYNLKGSYNYDNSNDNKLNIFNNVCFFDVEDFSDFRIIYLKIYGDSNKVYSGTIVLDYVEVEPFIKISHIEKFLLDKFNCLVIVDKYVFDNFDKDFEVCILSENRKIIDNVNVSSFNDKFKIYLKNIPMSNTGMYYIKFQKGNIYRVCSFFVKKINYLKHMFISSIDESGMDLKFYNFKQLSSNKVSLIVKIFLLIDGLKYQFAEHKLNVSSKNIRINFSDNILINKMEYLCCFDFNKNRTSIISFTYIGRNLYLDDIEKNINELSKMLSDDFFV